VQPVIATHNVVDSTADNHYVATTVDVTGVTSTYWTTDYQPQIAPSGFRGG
jgi:hypothetical protein